MLSYLLPTHNRPRELARTLTVLGMLSGKAHDRIGGAEVIVVDNASDPAVQLERQLPNGFPVRVVRLDANFGAAGRNAGAQVASGDWLIMLDDDSHPLDEHHVDVLLDAPADVAAVGADITLPCGVRESGGLPEVFIGCGAAVRRDAFLAVGGYDPAFDYYAEEYDLCARLLLDGWRIIHDTRFRVRHEKSGAGRDMNRILQRLVRNNGWVVQRYAPPELQLPELACMIARYADIAIRENAANGFAAGMAELLQAPVPRGEDPWSLAVISGRAARLTEPWLTHQSGGPRPCRPCEQLKAPDQTQTPRVRAPRRRQPMPADLYARFTGLAHVRQTLAREFSLNDKGVLVAIVDEGKGAAIVRQALIELGATIVSDPTDAEILVMGAISPGPMLDAYERCTALGQDVVLPWFPAGQLLPSREPATIS